MNDRGALVACAMCGTVAPASQPPVTWSVQVTARGTEWVCERCTRDNLRSIEGKLDTEWW